MSRSAAFKSRSRSRFMEFLARGSASATRIPRIVTVAISSISVKPPIRFDSLMGLSPELLQLFQDARWRGHPARQTLSHEAPMDLSSCPARDSESQGSRYRKPQERLETAQVIRSRFLSCYQCCEQARQPDRPG